MARNEHAAGLISPFSLYYETVNLPTHYFLFEMKVDMSFEILTHITEVLLRIQFLWRCYASSTSKYEPNFWMILVPSKRWGFINYSTRRNIPEGLNL